MKIKEGKNLLCFINGEICNGNLACCCCSVYHKAKDKNKSIEKIYSHFENVRYGKKNFKGFKENWNKKQNQRIILG